MSGAWGKKLEITPEPPRVERSDQDQRSDSQTFGTQRADALRAQRAQHLFSLFQDANAGNVDVADRDSTRGRQNLIPDNHAPLRRRYSIATINQFEALLPNNANGHMNRGHVGEDNPYVNAVSNNNGPDGRGVNMHVQVGASQHADQAHAASAHAYVSGRFKYDAL